MCLQPLSCVLTQGRRKLSRGGAAIGSDATRPTVFFFDQLNALVASRYIEGRALTSCSSTLSLSIRGRDQAHSHLSRATRTEIREFKVQWPHGKKQIGTKSGAAQAAPAAPLPTAL